MDATPDGARFRKIRRTLAPARGYRDSNRKTGPPYCTDPAYV
jgi:hypothetical protein